MSKEYNIDPCRATIYQLQKTRTPCDYNSVTNGCYQVCSDWYGPGSNAKGTPCYEMCTKCAVPFVHARGKDTCYFKPRPTAVFDNTPTFFPTLFRQSGDLRGSLVKCHTMCKDNAVNCNECHERCNVDAAALVLGGDEPKGEDRGAAPSHKPAPERSGGMATGFAVTATLLLLVLLVFFVVKFSSK